jgi:hypothetical protein
MIDFLFVMIGLNTVIIFMFKIEWLFNTKSLLILTSINAFLFAIAFFYDKKFNTIGALKMPGVSLLIFCSLNWAFMKIYNRRPDNTFWSFKKKPIEDVLFSIIFWIIGIALPVFMFL